jgi:hypothetical protein
LDPARARLAGAEEIMDDRKLEALARKNAAKQAAPKGKRRTYDPTLDATRSPEGDDDEERKRFFKEMKRREF